MFRRIVRVVATVCASLVVGAAAPARIPARTTFVIRNVRIFDGERVFEANSVAVADGKIVGVGMNVASPPGAQVVDGSGDTRFVREVRDLDDVVSEGFELVRNLEPFGRIVVVQYYAYSAGRYWGLQ